MTYLSAILYCAASIAAPASCQSWHGEDAEWSTRSACEAHITARRAEIEANLAMEGRVIWWGRDGRMATFVCNPAGARLPEPAWFRERRSVPVVPFQIRSAEA